MFDNITSQLNDEISENEALEIIGSNEHAYRNELTEIAERIKDGYAFEKVAEEINLSISNAIFREIVFSDLNDHLQPFNETAHLRNLNETEFKKHIKVVFDNYILRFSYLSEIELLSEEPISKEDLENTIHFLSYLKHAIIVRRLSETSLYTTMYNMFRFDKTVGKIIWDLFEANRHELILGVLLDSTNTTKEIKNSVKTIMDIFDDIMEDEE